MEYNRSQILGLDLDKHIVLDAGAGTGKTTVMAERYVQHLLSSEQRATLVLPDATSDENSLSKELMVPVSQRQNLGTWTGLLPSEVVAITFTRKAAAELKARIRKKLNNLKADVKSLTSEDHVFDFRLKGDETVSKMLISQLDDAPVSTIDAFFSRLVSMHMDMLTDKPTKNQISDERSQILREHSIFSAWRARNFQDARKMGILDGDNFINARNRLTVALNGQHNAEKVLVGLMKNSLFVEEARKHLKSKSEDFGVTWVEHSNISKEIFIDIFTNPVAGLVEGIIEDLVPALRAFIDSYLEEYTHFIEPTYVEHGGYSRFHQLQTLITNVPDSEFAKIQWLYAVLRTGLSESAIKKSEFEKFFSAKSFNQEKDWRLGILGITKAKKTMKPQKRAKEVADTAEHFRQQIIPIIDNRDCKLLFKIGSAAHNFIPQILFSEIPPNSKYARDEITNPPQRNVHSKEKSVLSSDLQLQVLSDLFTVFKGCQQVFTDLKKSEEVHDFDDTMRYAEDLLLAKCPSLVRTIWPQEIVQSLDELSEDSWTDAHISKAMRLAKPYPNVHDDLVMRFKILQNLRRKYRAFIIDEFQDTNPAQFRLLTRLWGRRSREASEGDTVLGYWDPTICVVGDMKQSIYRFRQAEVTVMKKATQYIKEANNLEVHEKRMTHLLKEGMSRDPRYQRGTGFTPADKEGDSRVHGPKEEYNSVAFKDGSELVLVDDEKRDRRSLGHIDLTSNFRTRHDLMNTFNHLFEDVFDPRHHKFPGDWHASAQKLIPASRDDSPGKLEWIMPIPKKSDESSTEEKIDVFSSPTSSSKELEAELIALRIRAMLDKTNRKIWSTESEKLVDIGPDEEDISADDIMILLHSRGRAPGIISALQKYRIPTQVDQYGLLLEQDVVKPLISVLELLARPDSRHAQASIALSPIMSCSEAEVHQKMQKDFTVNGWESMQEFCNSERSRSLIYELDQLNRRGARYEVLEAILDNSDLLFAYPEPHERQHAEAFLALVRMIGNECGDEIAVIYSRVRELMSLDNSGPKASSSSLSGSVKLMTIHKSKGLESKVVIVSGLFAAGKQDSSMTGGSDVLVTPELISCWVRPWQSRETPAHGLYELTSAIEKAQKRAERRREFYVALTRVKSHLILCGVNDSQEADNNFTALNLKPSPDSMANFLVEGLRGSAWIHKLQDSCWLLANDLESTRLEDGGELWKSTNIDPLSLHNNSGLPEDCVNSITVYHSPDCFAEQKSESLGQSVARLQENFEFLRDRNEQEERLLPNATHKFRVTAHSLDTSSNCHRRHWLTRVRGWNPERFDIPKISTSDKSQSTLPSPTKFGLLAHRLVEIGLANPATQLSSSKLDQSWLMQNRNGLQNEELADRVLRELGLGDDATDGKIESTKTRLLEIGELIHSGPLGILCDGGEFDGFKVEGLRTELPFFHSESVSSKDIVRHSDIGKQNPVSVVDAITAYFDGRIDLVIALTDSSGNGYLQVVDLKTKGCLNGFDFDNVENGTKLQRYDDLFSIHPETHSEKALVKDYRLQLALYSLILENSEAQKPVGQRRKILPPAILVGASGKMIRLTDEDYANAKDEFTHLLEYMGTLSAYPNEIDEPPRIDDEATCKKCPFFSGDIKLCGPRSFDLFGGDN